MLNKLRALFAEYPRIGLTGCSGAGKTTLARELLHSGSVPRLAVVTGDDYAHLPWAEQPLAVAETANAVSNASRVLVDWVQVPRAIRKGLNVDAVVVLAPRGSPTPRQLAQWRGQLTVLSELSVPVIRAPSAGSRTRESRQTA